MLFAKAQNSAKPLKSCYKIAPFGVGGGGGGEKQLVEKK
jgi:hypothetical protein